MLVATTLDVDVAVTLVVGTVVTVVVCCVSIHVQIWPTTDGSIASTLLNMEAWAFPVTLLVEMGAMFVMVDDWLMVVVGATVVVGALVVVVEGLLVVVGHLVVVVEDLLVVVGHLVFVVEDLLVVLVALFLFFFSVQVVEEEVRGLVVDFEVQVVLDCLLVLVDGAGDPAFFTSRF